MRNADSYARAMAQIVDHLVRASGVDPRSLDTNRLHWVIEARCRSLKLDGAEVYAERLNSSLEELDALIDAVVVQETRFFRDSSVFHHIQLWLPRMTADFPGPLRILSAPCSTGQEAYSLAATLQQAGIPLARFTIDAFDISKGALDIAQRGLYPEAAMRNLSVDQRQACGVFDGKQWRMHDALRQRIRFERRNLAEPGALNPQPCLLNVSQSDGQYHLILSRNLFIYLCPQARTSLAQSLASALVPGGRLVIGTADRVEELNAIFLSHKPAASFAFTHRQIAEGAARSGDLTGSGQDTSKRAAIAGEPKQSQAALPAMTATIAAVTETAAAQTDSSSAASFFQSALQLMQHGNHRKAERRCRQALYLDPRYLPALELLAKLWLQHPNLRVRLALDARIHRSRLASHASAPSSALSGNAPSNREETVAAWEEIV